MANVYEHRVTRGAARLVRRWDPADGLLPWGRGGGRNAGRRGPSTAGRAQTVFSNRSRRTMRYEWSALPWERLGMRPVMITLTYPAEWRSVVPDARVMVAHREAFKEAWRKRFGAPVGVWVVEFQPRRR